MAAIKSQKMSDLYAQKLPQIGHYKAIDTNYCPGSPLELEVSCNMYRFPSSKWRSRRPEGPLPKQFVQLLIGVGAWLETLQSILYSSYCSNNNNSKLTCALFSHYNLKLLHMSQLTVNNCGH